MGGRSLGINHRSFAHGTVICTWLAHTLFAHGTSAFAQRQFNKVNKTLQQSSSTIKKKGKRLFEVLSPVPPPPRYFYRVGSDDHLQYNLIDR